jgi:hypothetical protein
MSNAELQSIADVGKEVLQMLPHKAGACAHLTACWVTIVRERLQLPVKQMVGHLTVNGTLVFGRPKEKLQVPLAGSVENWDGHSWLTYEEYIGDISIFRTAYSSVSPLLLKEVILQHFGEGRGLLLARMSDCQQTGISYLPMRELADSEIEGLKLGTRRFFQVLGK